MINAGHSRYAPGKRLGGDRPGAYWEVDFIEVKPAKYGNKYLLVFFNFLQAVALKCWPPVKSPIPAPTTGAARLCFVP